MKKQLFTIALLVSIAGTMGAMQPLKDFNGPVKAVTSSPRSIIATLPDGSQISLDPSIQWNMVNGVLSRMSTQPVAAQAVQAAPKAPAVQTVPKAAATTVVVRRHAGNARPMVFACSGGRCGMRPVVQAPAAITSPTPQAPAIQPAPKAPAIPKMVFRCANGRCGRR